MRSLKESILSTTKVGRFDEWNTFKRENAHPKTREELLGTIKQAMKLKGNKVDLNWIDTSAIDDMSYLFKNSKFDGDISKWDVSNVKNMACMFQGSVFNGDISEWDVSNVEDLSFMFYDSEFNGDISKWDVGNAEIIYGMFRRSKFNGDISKWDVSKVRNMDYIVFGSPLEKNPPKWYKGDKG